MFTTPCFIRKNTKELRDKLSEFGYNRGTDKWHINDNRKLFAYQHPMKRFDTPHFVVGDSLDLTEYGLLKNKFIDCGENEDLFLAIAASRDDTDKDQLFFQNDDTNCEYPTECIHDEFHMFAMVIDTWEYIDNKDLYHKGTPNELQKHFKINR